MAYRVAPAPPPKIPDGPDHIGAAQRVARRNRRIGLVTTAIVLGVVVASVMVHDTHRARQRAAFESAKVDVEACLLGPEPLAAGGSASCALRVRRRQLTAMATPIERRIDEALGGWPMRCSEASKRMMRQAIELEDLQLQHEADRSTAKLATMKALSAPLELMLCLDEHGLARHAHLSHAASLPSLPSLPSLATPLDLDALVAHGAPALAARTATELEADPKLTALLPEAPADDDGPKADAEWPGVIHVGKRIVSRETFDLNDPELRASDTDRFRPARVGGAILAVWRAGTRGGLRMRVAPIDRLAASHDFVLFDDLVMGGVMQGTPTLAAFRVYGGRSAARIFLVTSRGTWVVEVTESGATSLR